MSARAKSQVSLQERPVITGIGITAPNGLGMADYWSATRAGVSGIRPIKQFDASQYVSRLAGEVPDFDPAELLPSRLLPQTDHMTRLALVAAEQALADAGLDGEAESPYDRGIVTASSAGGFEFGQAELQRFFGQGYEFMGAYMSFAWFYAVNSGQISIRHQLKGPGGVLVADHAGGLDAIAHARRHIRRGSKVIVSGGVDGAICPWGWVAQLTSGRLSTSEDPSAAYLPFDPRAAGHVPAEGGAILIVEDAEAARQRDARQVYGTVAGYSATFDPKPGSGREPTLRRAIEQALSDAQVDPADVDVVFADAAAMPEEDRIEAEAIAAVFGPHAVPVTAPKTMVGRIHAGGGALDAATALLSIRDGIIPPTVNIQPSPDCPIDLVAGEALPAAVRTALVLARGQGGFNSALVVQAA
jgi:act minimal PKS chain-length factor (CLF/KS beta)